MATIEQFDQSLLRQLLLERVINAQAIPIRPTNVILDADLFIPKARGMAAAQQELDRAYAADQVMHITPGTRIKIVVWTGRKGVAACFDPKGTQVGYAQIEWDPDPEQRELEMGYMSYDTAIVVARHAIGQGLGFAMMELLEKYAALCNVGIGAAFHYYAKAETPEAKAAVIRIFQQLGAIPFEHNYLHFVVKRQFSANLKQNSPGFSILTSNTPVVSQAYK